MIRGIFILYQEVGMKRIWLRFAGRYVQLISAESKQALPKSIRNSKTYWHLLGVVSITVLY
jgi:hypothetical protein